MLAMKKSMMFGLKEVVGFILTSVLATGGIVGSYFSGIKGGEQRAEAVRSEVSAMVKSEEEKRSATDLDHEKRLSATEARVERIPYVEAKVDELLRANGINPKGVVGEEPAKGEAVKNAPLVKGVEKDGSPVNAHD